MRLTEGSDTTAFTEKLQQNEAVELRERENESAQTLIATSLVKHFGHCEP